MKITLKKLKQVLSDIDADKEKIIFLCYISSTFESFWDGPEGTRKRIKLLAKEFLLKNPSFGELSYVKTEKEYSCLFYHKPSKRNNLNSFLKIRRQMRRAFIIWLIKRAESKRLMPLPWPVRA